MPEGNPAAYDGMTTDQLIQQLEGEVQGLDQAAAEIGIDLTEGGEAAEGDLEIEADAEQALADAEQPGPSDSDAEAALTTVLSEGLGDPTAILDALRSQGFELVRIGGSPEEEIPDSVVEEMPEEAPEAGLEEEEPFRDARRRAAERATGGVA